MTVPGTPRTSDPNFLHTEFFGGNPLCVRMFVFLSAAGNYKKKSRNRNKRQDRRDAFFHVPPHIKFALLPVKL